MEYRTPRLPSMACLKAFEAVIRLKGVSRAATSLLTSQSAISRHLKQLEDLLGAPLFEKEGRHLVPNAAGRVYYDAVSTSLEKIRQAHIALAGRRTEISIACTHEVSHLLLMPYFSDLRQMEGAYLRMMVTEYDMLPLAVEAGADIVLDYRYIADRAESHQPIIREQIAAVAAPAFIDKYETLRTNNIGDWQAIPRLELEKQNFAGAGWQTLFDFYGVTAPQAPIDVMDSYVYLLEAAVAGKGVAVGWRGFVERYLENGSLLCLSREWIEGPTVLCSHLTPSGRKKAGAHTIQQKLASLFPPAP